MECSAALAFAAAAAVVVEDEVGIHVGVEHGLRLSVIKVVLGETGARREVDVSDMERGLVSTRGGNLVLGISEEVMIETEGMEREKK